MILIENFLALYLILFSTQALAQVSRNFTKKEKPIYELGLGAIHLDVPNYPGSASSTQRTIPFPWIIYRGELLRADEEGSRLKLVGSDRFELGFSGGFNFPIESRKNQARKGMPDTNALLGLGPGLLYRVPVGSKLHRLTLGLGVRVNFSIETNLTQITNQGYIIEPYVRHWFKLSEESRVTFLTGLSLSAAESKYQAFFYDVPKRYETTERDAYRSKGGFFDLAVSVGTSIEAIRTLTVFGGFFYSNLSLSANRHSPLMETNYNTGLAVGLSWMFKEKYLSSP